jgi:proteasome lid subunit RPN8/RPN11
MARYPQELDTTLVAPRDAAAVRIRRDALDAIVAHARTAQPAECCGMLVGSGGSIEQAVAARNLEDRPTRFLIDPKDHIDARREARRRGLEVIGFYHSHPYSPSWPSPADLAEATYAGALYLIVSLREATPEARIFEIVDGVAEERPLVAA